jgi:predicted PurR-regulated permease PerM
MNEHDVARPNSMRRKSGSAMLLPPGGAHDQGGSYIEKALAITVLLILLVGCLIVLRPFVAAILWATILSFSTWPAYLRLSRALGGRRGLAAGILTLVIAALLLVPVVLLGMSLAENVVKLIEALHSAMVTGLPPLPVWTADLPVIGPRLTTFWATLGQDAAARSTALHPYVGTVRDWLLARGGDVVDGVLQLSLSLLSAFFFYRDGPAILATLESIGTKLAGARAGMLLRTAGGTINGVVRGVLGTAFVQAALMGVALWAADVPGALLLGFLSFFLAIIPMALLFVWLPATIWLASQDAVLSAAAMAVWGIVVGQIDNFLRPYLISKGSELPVLLILLGILGGALAFGFIGIFLGPTLLAIAHSLIRDWGSPVVDSMPAAGRASQAPMPSRESGSPVDPSRAGTIQ